LISGTILASGIATIIQSKGISPVGAKLPSLMGIDVTLSAPAIAVGERFGLPGIIGAILANGEAALGAARLVEMAGATVAGIGIVIEKSFQPGRQLLEAKGYDVYSLARLKKLGIGIIEFVND